MDIGVLLGAGFYADVEVKSNDSGKKKDDGTPYHLHSMLTSKELLSRQW